MVLGGERKKKDKHPSRWETVPPKPTRIQRRAISGGGKKGERSRNLLWGLDGAH